MKKAKFPLILLACILLYGCAFGAKMESMTYQGEQKTYDDTLKNNVRIISVYGGERTNPVGPPGISNEEFYGAVKESLIKQGLFSEDGKYQLKILMAEIDQPSWGADITVSTYVQYVLTDTSNNSTVLDKMISASYTVPLDETFAGTKRIRLANEGSGKINIERFLEKLSKLKINPK